MLYPVYIIIGMARIIKSKLLGTLAKSFSFLYNSNVANKGSFVFAPVAQLDSASDSDSEGRWFESSRAYQIKKTRPRTGLFYLMSLHLKLT